MGPERLAAASIAAIFIVTEIAITAVLIVVSWRAATGRLARSQLTGIRTPSTLLSDQAWVAGHRATWRLAPLHGANAVIACSLLLAVIVRSWPAGPVIVLGIGCLVVFVGIALYTAVVASRAASRTTPQDADRPAT
ncbi:MULTISPECIES: SdpI family protein [unclassified Mycobacterium]|uniref:SdpI family protein n=1 Tax=unclassified Mycobacterium TaxID=2642494 RepID=UPI00048EE694